MQHLLLAIIVSWLIPQFYIQKQPGAQAPDQKPAATSPELSEANKLNEEVMRLYGEKKYTEALPLAKRCLDLREKALGQNHEMVVSAMNNLAAIYGGMKQYVEAESLYRHSLTILEKRFGNDSNYLTYTLENLAFTCFAVRNNSDAEKFYQRALALKEKKFGPDHLEIAHTLDLLGTFYERTDRFSKAGDSYKRSLAIKEAALGPNDPVVAQSLDDCACALILNDQAADARPYQDRAKEIRKTSEYQTINESPHFLQGTALRRVEPAYPTYARQMRISGTVIVAVTVDECGKVISAHAVSGPNELKDAAVSAARGWRFSPTRVAGRPVKVIGTVTFNFRT